MRRRCRRRTRRVFHTGRAAFLGGDVTTTLARVLEREPDWQALPAELATAARRTLEDEFAAIPVAPVPPLGGSACTASRWAAGHPSD